MPYLKSLPEHSTMAELAKTFRHVFKDLTALTQTIMRSDSPLSAQQREFLFAVCSGLNDCHYCHGAHTATAEALGADAEAIRAAVRDIETADVDESFKVLLRFVKKLTLTPGEISQADADAVYAAGWDEGALHDTVAVCSIVNFYNRYIIGAGVDATDDVLGKRGRALAEFGYVPTKIRLNPQ
jgi:uncharacterized peroxidase-related enzyme